MPIYPFILYGKPNKTQFSKKSGNCIQCACCGYEAEPVKYNARKVWEFEDDNVLVYHFGNHTCEAKIVEEDLSEDASAFFKANVNAKPSQYPYERLRAMLKEGKPIADIYTSASNMAYLKKIQNVKQKVVNTINPVGHSFEAIAKIKEVSDKQDKYPLWKVQDGRLSENKMTVLFRSSKERVETAYATDFTKDNSYIFDPSGIITDEHGANRASIGRVLNQDLLDRAKSCEMHFYDCAHKVAKSDWSPKAKAEFITLIHDIYCYETPSANEVKSKVLMEWASKDKRKHVKSWFNKLWHI
ncbi:hypothetical protein QZH41_017769 [Actinostola sp. cb2023]|nr:hypothetical protein QZH41_017769 [Actinostola sp. cb2023]